MTPGTKSNAIFIATLLFLGSLVFSSAPHCQAQQATPNSEASAPSSAKSAENFNSPLSSSTKLQVFLPPVLDKNKPAWGTAFEADGHPLALQKLSINGKEVSTDDYGLFQFQAPDLPFSIIIGDDKKTLWKAAYSLTPRGLLISDKAAAEQIDRLDELEENAGPQVAISHAPAVLEPEQAFVVIGKNFSGKYAHDLAIIDGFESDVYAGSTRSLIAAAKKRIAIGPLKELSISSDDESSLPLELDLAAVELRSPAAGNSALELLLMGSNLPSLVALSNESPGSQMRYGGRRIGSQTIFLSPGGQANKIAVDMKGSTNLIPDAVSAHILSNGLFDPYSQKSSSELLGKKVTHTINEAEVVRLKRRMLSLESQLATIEKQRKQLVDNASSNAAAEISKLDAVTHSAALRLSRLNRSLRARHVIFAADGNSESEWTQLCDKAADNIANSLDNILANKEVGFTESRLIRSSPTKKPKLEQDSYSQIASSGMGSAQIFPPGSHVGSRRNRIRSIAPSIVPQGGRLVAPPAPYKFDPSDIASFFSDAAPDPVPRIKTASGGKTSRSKRKRNRFDNTAPKSQKKSTTSKANSAKNIKRK